MEKEWLTVSRQTPPLSSIVSAAARLGKFEPVQPVAIDGSVCSCFFRLCLLQASKLAKVLKRIALLDEGDIPSEGEFNFRPRSSALAAQWAQLGLNEGTPVPNSAAPPSVSDVTQAPNGNGTISAEPKAEESAPTEPNGTNGRSAVDGDSAPKAEV